MLRNNNAIQFAQNIHELSEMESLLQIAVDNKMSVEEQRTVELRAIHDIIHTSKAQPGRRLPTFTASIPKNKILSKEEEFKD